MIFEKLACVVFLVFGISLRVARGGWGTARTEPK